MDAIVTQMIILFVLVIFGYCLSKKKMMDAEFDRKLSELVINVTCPQPDTFVGNGRHAS